jgi:hypothetical protein
MEFDDPETALREARQRFIDSFDEICASVLRAFREGPDAIRVSRGRVHRLAGLAGVVGFRGVSRKALDLEAVLDGPAAEADVTGAVELMRGAFADDLNAPAPPWA